MWLLGSSCSPLRSRCWNIGGLESPHRFRYPANEFAYHGVGMRSRFVLLISVLVISLALNVWYFFETKRVPPQAPQPGHASAPSSNKSNASPDSAPTDIYAHNLMLRKGPDFRIYVRWLRGEMTRARPDVNPSFDNPDSFFLDVKTGVIRANIGDIAHLLNTSAMNSPLKNIKLSGNGEQIKLQGTLHKVIPLPIEIDGTIRAIPPNSIQLHVNKLSVLKIPVKGLMGRFHLTLSDLFQPNGVPGIQVTGNDILFDTLKMLPPPHIRGELTTVRIANPDLEEVYGKAEKEVQHVEQWRNFLRFHNGTIDFGKLTMHQVDIMMIDISNDPWFDLDLANYQTQLVNGYTHITPDAGLQIFMPDLDELPKKKTATQKIGIQWFKNRNKPVPSSVKSK